MAADLKTTSESRTVPHAAALYLAVVQFLFATTWTLYVIFLPALLESVGISRSVAIWMLMLDQIIFTVSDTVAGIMADRVQRLLGELGPTIVKLTALSCVAFLALPQFLTVGPDGAVLAQATFLGLTLVWTATSSFLRAPPWVLIGKYAAAPSVPYLAALSLIGLAAGSAVAPYLGTVLRNTDPRLPFALSSITLFATTCGLIWVERFLSKTAGGSRTARGSRTAGGQREEDSMKLQTSAATAGGFAALGVASRNTVVFLVAMAALALGYQVHISFNSQAFYLRYASAEQLDLLLPVFWVGYSLLSLPSASLASRLGSVPVLAGCAALGAVGTAITVAAPSLEVMVVGQLLAGGAWGSILMAGVSAALGFGRIGREGRTLGLWFSVQAMAAVIRIAAVAVQADKTPGFSDAATWAPPVVWLGGAAILATLAVHVRASEQPKP